MTFSWPTLLFFTLLCVMIQGLFALFEMAAVSLSRVRLQYAISRSSKRAIWLDHLLKRPSRLFGTTLIGINTALQVGSECSRKLYESIHLDPDWAPLTQVFIVVILGELAPMFAARRHPQTISMALIPVMVFFSRIFYPIIWAFDALSRFVHKLMGKAHDVPFFLSREEVKTAFEDREEGEDEFNPLVTQIFQMKNCTAGQIMIPLQNIVMAPSSSTVADLRHLLAARYVSLVPIFHHFKYNIVAVAYLRNLLRLDDGKKIVDSAHSPWFVTQETSVLDLLDQFRHNNQRVAIILDASGKSVGLLTLEDIVSQIFGGEKGIAAAAEEVTPYIQRTLSGEMLMEEFNAAFEAEISFEPQETLSDRLLRELEHAPARGETVRLDSFLFTVIEPTLRGIKTVSVRSV